MRRGITSPDLLIDLSGIDELTAITTDAHGMTHRRRRHHRRARPQHRSLPTQYRALAQAAEAIAGPGHRTMATVGGNLCLDTRCIYYNQSEWWRSANAYCLKNRGDTCHVAPQGQRCHAAFTGDLAPALLVLGAEIEIAGAEGQRRIPLGELYVEDGKAHLTLGRGRTHRGRASAGQAAALGLRKGAHARRHRLSRWPVWRSRSRVKGKTIGSLRIALTGTNSRPFVLDGTDAFVGQALDDKLLQAIDRAGAEAGAADAHHARVAPITGASPPPRWRAG